MGIDSLLTLPSVYRLGSYRLPVVGVEEQQSGRGGEVAGCRASEKERGGMGPSCVVLHWQGCTERVVRAGRQVPPRAHRCSMHEGPDGTGKPPENCRVHISSIMLRPATSDGTNDVCSSRRGFLERMCGICNTDRVILQYAYFVYNYEQCLDTLFCSAAMSWPT